MKEGEEVYLKILPCPELGIQESSFIHLDMKFLQLFCLP